MVRQLRIEEIAVLVGVSAQTINNWYRWKRVSPDNEMAKLLPEFKQDGNRQTRYWTEDDVPKLIKFKDSIPHGRLGILGLVTQKYYKNRQRRE